MTDTGSFRYPSTTAVTHFVASKLVEAGADNGQIHVNVYDTNTESRLRLTGYALTQKLTVLPQYATAYFVLTAKELSDFNYQKGDTEGLVNYGLSMGNIKFSAIFMEKDGQVKISFRSKGEVPVNEFMSAHFSGGGHKNAAGGRSNKPLDVTIHEFLSLIPAFMERHK
jgi:phosphoesterase RecJ-like protein